MSRPQKGTKCARGNLRTCALCAFLRLTFLLVLLLPACGQRTHIRPLAPDAVILAFGDSLTAGSGAGEGESYPAVLGQMLGHTVINAGVPGETSDEGLARLPSVLEENHPALVILCEGGNDLLQKQDDAIIVTHLSAMIDAIKASGADVIVIGVPRPALLLSTASFYKSIARDYGIPCECDTLSDILSDPGLKSDQIHPNAKGYLKLAVALAQLIGSK